MNFFEEGKRYKDIGRHEEAIECFDKAIILKPHCPDAYREKGYCFFRLDRFQEAIECCDKAISLKPHEYYIYEMKGNCLYMLQIYQEAIKCYEKAIFLRPDHFKAYLMKGYSFCGLERFKESIEAFQGALKLKPNSSQCFYAIARLFECVGMIKEAMRYLKLARLSVRCISQDDPEDAGKISRVIFELETMGDALKDIDKEKKIF